MKRRQLATQIGNNLQPQPQGLPTMKIDFSTVLLDLDGRPLKGPDTSKDPVGTNQNGEPLYPLRDLTLANASVQGLMSQTQESIREPGEVKLRCYTLAQMVHKGGKIDLEPGDADFIKGRIASIFAPAVVGPAFNLLNGN